MLRICLFIPVLLSIALTTSAADHVVVQSTTSTQNSGLLDDLFPKFTAATGIEIRTVAVGTGQAIKNAMRGDGDVLLVHAKAAEEKFVAQGHGIKRYDLMYNDFVIVGPKEDPAGIRNLDLATSAFAQIARSKSYFISRGDDSGTHKKERALWTATTADPNANSGRWYLETGSGMGATLNVAAGKNAYTLTDRATWLSFANRQNLTVLFEGDPILFNQYGIILVNPSTHPHVNAQDGQRLIDWMLSDEGQQAIGSFKRNGEQLFYPNAAR